MIVSPQEGPVYSVLGDPVRLVVSQQSTGGAYCVLELTAAPGSGVPAHIHQHEDEVFFIVEGTFEVTLDDEVSQAGPGTIINLPRGQRHGYRNLSPHPGKVWVTVVPGKLEAMFGDLAGDPPSPQRLMEVCQGYGIEFQPPLA